MSDNSGGENPGGSVNPPIPAIEELVSTNGVAMQTITRETGNLG